METTDSKLSDLFKIRGDSPEIRSAAERLAGESEEFGIEVSLPEQALKDELIKSLVELFHSKLMDALLEAWKNSRELCELSLPDADEEPGTIEVELANHSIEWESHPGLEVVVNGAKMGGIELDLNCSFDLSGCVLTIQDGKITSCSIGNCNAETVLGWKGTQLLQLTAPKTAFLDRIKINPPVELAPTSPK